MTDYTIMSPEMRLIKEEEFYLFYEMMMQPLKTDNVIEGINKSLKLLKIYLKSGNIALFRKSEDGIYSCKITDSDIGDLTDPLSCIVNKTSQLTEKKEILDLDLNLSERIKKLTLIHMFPENSHYILAVLNNSKEVKEDQHFWTRVRDTMHIILKRAASYERNVKAITTDLLTDLDNRNSYEMRMQNINEDDANLIVGIFDLFRLKYVNDNYSHDAGDKYIKTAAKILARYWPKQTKIISSDSSESYVSTGHCLYRYGGDEFVLLTSAENLKLASIKGLLAATEAELIKLDIGEIIPVGLNYGIVQHTPGEHFKDTFIKADALMQEDKAKMYAKHKLERRR